MRAIEFITENTDHSKTDRAVEELRAALLDKKDQLQSANNADVYDIIDRIMTRIADEHGMTGKKLHDLWVARYQQVPDTWIMQHDSELVTERKKRRRSKRSFGGYWYPGYGYYSSGVHGGEDNDSGDSGGNGGESVTESKDSEVLFIGNNVAVVGQEHGKRLQLSKQDADRVRAIARRHGAWYEGNGMDRELTKGIVDEYTGSWDDDLLSPAIKGYPAPFLYVLFSNIKENDTVEGKIGFDPESTIFDRILDTQPSANYFSDRQFDAATLQKFLQLVSEGPYDFVAMSQAPATESNVRRFFTQGEQLMFPNNWTEYPYRAGRVAKSVNDLRDRFLATRQQGVYVAGSDHLLTVQKFLDQAVVENFADGKQPGRKGLSKRMGVNTKASVSSLRKTAKNSTGEKARMAHWLANMKAGRQR